MLIADIAPTIADLAGLPSAPGVDGRSLAPLLFQTIAPVGSWRDAVLIEHWRPQPDSVGPLAYYMLGYRAVRTPEHLYVEWDTGEFELYDRIADPFELENIYPTANPLLVDELSARLDLLIDCAGSACSAAEGGF